MFRVRAILVCVLALLAAAAPVAAHPLDAREAPRFEVDAPRAIAAQQPPLLATPRADCGPGSVREPGLQGRVPRDADPGGFRCNLEQVGHQGTTGGFKVLRYIDKAGRECAYYDSTLLFPANVQTLSSQPTGVAVLDMGDSTRPTLSTTLKTPAMQSTHESLVLNEKRGLLAAVLGNPAFAPGVIDIYDVSEDCRNPVLQSSAPVGLLGHESGFAADGNTFYATSISTGQITAVDVTNPKLPVPLFVGQYRSHGLTLSEDGNRAYVAASEGLLILDTSEIQARRPSPQVREISRLAWDSLTIPQTAIPVTIGGKPFIVEVDEFSSDEDGELTGNGVRVGAGRIIDLADERAPKVISNLRLAVHQPENRAQLAGDPGASSVVQGYAGHYCSVPQRVEPGIVACSMIASGLRVFDIRDPYAPKEIAYFVAPKRPSQTAGEPSNYAMSAPAFAPERREIWYADGNSGFYALRLAAGLPAPGQRAPAPAACSDTAGLRSVGARGLAGGRAQLAFERRSRLPVDVDVFRVSEGRRVVRERLVARFAGRDASVAWNGRANRGGRRRVGDGDYFVRYTMRSGGRRVDVRRVVLRRRGGRFTSRPDYFRRDSCGLLSKFKLERPAFGGVGRRPLRAAYRLASDARVTVTITRGGRVVRRFAPVARRGGRTYRISLPPAGRAPGDHRVRVVAEGGGRSATAVLTARRL